MKLKTYLPQLFQSSCVSRIRYCCGCYARMRPIRTIDMFMHLFCVTEGWLKRPVREGHAAGLGVERPPHAVAEAKRVRDHHFFHL
jgi:hypothetical protein